MDIHLTGAAANQNHNYDRRATQRSFTVGDCVWLSVPTAGKLDPRWEGGWYVKTVKSPVTYEITDDRRTKVVHINIVFNHPKQIIDQGNHLLVSGLHLELIM